MMICFSVVVMTAGNNLVSDPANLRGHDFTNPIIPSDYSDPDVVSSPDGKTFYMTASSFQCTPGLPILKSNDLVNWRLVNYALPAVPPIDYYKEGPRHGKGVWAPSIRYHNGEYYIFYGDPDYGVFMLKATDPEGSWSDPLLIWEGKGIIDTTPLWDEDGRAYLVNAWAASRSGFNSILNVSEMSPDGTRLLSGPRIVFDGNDGVNHTVEGPKFYRRGEYYYILAPAGGVEKGWQLALRSKNVYGPYESKIVMAQGDTDINGPHQGGWVTTADGEDWFLHFQDQGPYGRVIHLNPLHWADGWPVIGLDADGDGCGQPVRKFKKPSIARDIAAETPAEDDPILYEWHANYSDFYGFPIPDGLMRLYGHRLSDDYVNMWEVPNLWLQKFPARSFTFTAQVRVSAKENSNGASSGIIVMGWDYARLGLVKRGEGFELQLTTCTDAEQGGKGQTHDIAPIAASRVYGAGSKANVECDIWLRVKVTDDAVCHFSYSLNGKKFTDIPLTFKAREGKWIGAKVGFYSTVPHGVHDRGWIDVITSITKKN